MEQRHIPRVMLAPMAGVTDIPFRQLCREQGADLTFTEMVSAKGLSYANEKTRHLLALAPNEQKVGVQIFGHEPQVMAQQAAWIEDMLGVALEVIDINMGCPARKIVKKGDGAALMRDHELAVQIVCSVTSHVKTPVSVKFRRGWQVGEETAPEFARRMEDAGAARITVHGRFAEQLYRGCADWECIARVKEVVSVPVVGNGDVQSGEDVVRMLETTGCDDVMIARAAEGNPWVFADAASAISRRFGKGDVPFVPPTPVERIEAARRHAQLLDAMGRKVVVRMRKHAMWYMKGLPGASAARGRLNDCETLQDFERVFDDLLGGL